MSGTQYLTPLTGALEDAGVPFELLEHAVTATARDEAAALGLRPDEVAKTIVVAAEPGNVRVVVPASERLDLHKVRDALETVGAVRLLTEHDLARDYPEFELGAVPPLGGRPDDVIVDRRLAALATVVLEAGAHDRSVRLPVEALVETAGARVADVCAT